MSEVVEVIIPAAVAAVVLVEPAEAGVIEAVTAGPQGPPGASPVASRYDARIVAPVAGVVTLDLSIATTFLVMLDQNVTSIVFTNGPADDEAQGVNVYFRQDGTGGRTVAPTAWPAGRHAPSGIAPVLSTAANALDLVVVNAALASLGIVAVTLVAPNYLAF